MQPLRLTEAPDLELHPEDLFNQLERQFIPFDDMVKNLHCSLDHLGETLAAPETSTLLKLKTQVACLQVQLLAIRAAPHATSRLIALTNETEKPEVARRAATTLLHLAGVATDLAAQAPAPAPVPPPPPPPPPEKDPLDNERASDALHLAYQLWQLIRSRQQRLNRDVLKNLPNKNALLEALRPFLENDPNQVDREYPPVWPDPNSPDFSDPNKQPRVDL